MSIEYTKEVSEILQKCAECPGNNLETYIKDLRKLALAVLKENRELRAKINLLEKNIC